MKLCRYPSALGLALALAGQVAPPVSAQTPVAIPATDLTADLCITYRREGNDAFHLVNSCNETLSVAICAETTQTGGCARDIGWQSHNVAARSDVPGSYQPLQVINIIACKSPAVVRLQSGGRGSCEGGTASLPLLLASSLKNPSSIITPADYPRNVRAEGTTRFELVIDTNGRAQNCTITASAGNESLDKATCNAFVKRARFTPATDINGQAVPGRYRGSVTWKEP
ncbi:MAG: energy transducer TonB [Sphingorhabdus sp.]